MKGSIIDSIIAIVVISIIIAIIKYGGYFIGLIIGKVRKRLLGMKYPLQTDIFPIHALQFGDEMEIVDFGACKFQGKHKDKYYIESTNGAFSNNLSFMYVDKDFLITYCDKLYTKDVTKWQKRSFNRNRQVEN